MLTESKWQPRRNRQRALPAANAYAFTIADAQAMGLPGKSKIYEMVRDGELTFIKVGGRTMLTGDSVRAVLGVEAAE
jgi:excisionase family DNA binding protein